MNARKAALRVASICLKVAVFVVIILGIIYLGQNTYHYTHEIFNLSLIHISEPTRH